MADAYASYGWIPSEDLTFFRLDGYYSTLIRPGLRAISLNGMFQYSFNLYVSFNMNVRESCEAKNLES